MATRRTRRKDRNAHDLAAAPRRRPAPGRKSGHRHEPRGFTLTEMLVVIVIIGIFAGLVGSILQPDERARLQVEAERLARLLDIAALQARRSGRPIAWTANGREYRFWRLADGAGWSEIPGDALRARTLPAGMMVTSTRVENLPPLEHMRLEFSPYGPASAFRIELALGSARTIVAGSPVGDIGVMRERPGENGAPARR